MDFVKRAPDFATLYPSQESFEREQSEMETVSDAMLAGDIAGSMENLRRAFDPQGLAEANRTFNMRAFGHEMLRASGMKTVSSCEGRIDNILITVPVTDRGSISARNERHYRRLISLLGGGRTYTILCRPNHIAAIRSWFAGLADVQLDFAYSPRFNYSIWAQDAYVAVSDDMGQSTLIEGVCFSSLRRYDDSR